MLLNIKFEIVRISSKQRLKFEALAEFTIIGDEGQLMISFPCYERLVRWKRREGERNDKWHRRKTPRVH